MSRARGVAVAATVSAATVITVLVLQLTGHHGGAGAPKAARTPTSAQLSALEADATSGTRSRIKRAFLIPRGQALETSFVKAIAGWRSLRIDPRTFESTGEATGTVRATLTDTRGSSTWKLTIQLVQGEWRILSTEPDQ